MPVIEINTLKSEKTLNVSDILNTLCKEFAEKNSYNPGHVWAYWKFIDEQHYSVGGKTSNYLTKKTHSPIVKILAFEGNSEEKIHNMLITTAEILSREMGIDIGNIFIVYNEAFSGRVFDGGSVINSK